uniref:Uncharacterized protein n=1 Tax=Timema douglasi TaxID=61478 RepID=A0A7R8VHA9_TIMDO|nr:unnamed protein product [Timema douglasi]
MCDIAGMDQGPPDAIHPMFLQLNSLLALEAHFQPHLALAKLSIQLCPTKQGNLFHIYECDVCIAPPLYCTSSVKIEDRNEITQGVRDGSAHVLRCLKVLPKHMACISVSAFHMAARVLANCRENGERFLIPDARDLVSISQCQCTLGDMTRMEGIIAGKLSEEIPLEILACDAACVNFRPSEVALALLCWQLDRFNTRQDPSPGVDMVRLLSTAVELQKLCKISDAGFLRCHEVVASVLTLYEAQCQMPHRQRLVWKLSQRTLRYLRPTDKLSSLLPTIDEQGQLSLPLRIRSGSLSSEESTDSEKEDPLSEWGSYGRVDWARNAMHALPEESNILNNRFYNALVD